MNYKYEHYVNNIICICTYKRILMLIPIFFLGKGIHQYLKKLKNMKIFTCAWNVNNSSLNRQQIQTKIHYMENAYVHVKSKCTQHIYELF